MFMLSQLKLEGSRYDMILILYVHSSFGSLVYGCFIHAVPMSQPTSANPCTF